MQTAKHAHSIPLATFATIHGKPHILDLALGSMIGMPHARNIRRTYEKYLAPLAMLGGCHARSESPRYREHAPKAFYLNRAQALFLLRVAGRAAPVEAATKIIDLFRSHELKPDIQRSLAA